MFNQYDMDDSSRHALRNREQEEEVRRILRRRQRNINHTAYGLIAAAVGGVALLVWGFIYSDVLHDGSIPLTKGYAAFLAFAIVLGIAGSASTFTWMIVRDARARAAEEDVIREFRQQQQLVAIQEAITVFLREGDESALRAMEQTRNLLGTGTDPAMGTVRPFRGRG